MDLLNEAIISNSNDYRGFILYDFNLVLPNKDVFFKTLIQFNEERRIIGAPEFLPIVEFDEGEGTLFIPAENEEEGPHCYITGEVNPMSITGEFQVHPEFYDYTPRAVGYSYLEYLCKKFKGTMVGVYVKPSGLFPVKIIHGNSIETKLVLLDVEKE